MGWITGDDDVSIVVPASPGVSQDERELQMEKNRTANKEIRSWNSLGQYALIDGRNISFSLKEIREDIYTTTDPREYREVRGIWRNIGGKSSDFWVKSKGIDMWEVVHKYKIWVETDGREKGIEVYRFQDDSPDTVWLQKDEFEGRLIQRYLVDEVREYFLSRCRKGGVLSTPCEIGEYEGQKWAIIDGQAFPVKLVRGEYILDQSRAQKNLDKIFV
jgi:hypothetical protein